MSNEEAATGADQTAEKEVADANAEAAKSPAPELETAPVVIPPAEPAPVVTEPVTVHENFVEEFVKYLLKELKEGEAKVGQYFQLIFKKHDDGSHHLTVQPTGRAGDMAHVQVTATPTAE